MPGLSHSTLAAMALEPCTLAWVNDRSHNPASCAGSHETYAAALARLVDRTPTPWTQLSPKTTRFRPVLCVDPFAGSSSTPQYCALLPIPARNSVAHRIVGVKGQSPLAYIRALCRARCSDGSDAAEGSLDARGPDHWQSADVVWRGSGRSTEDCGTGPFWSLIARGEAHQVDRVIEAVAFLMDGIYATMTPMERVALIVDHFQRLRDGRAQHSHDLLGLRRPRSARPPQPDAAPFVAQPIATAVTASSACPVAAATASSAAPPVAADEGRVAMDSFCVHALNDSCSRSLCRRPGAHFSYRELFLRHLDRSRTTSDVLKARFCSDGESFHPRLFAESELANRWVAVLPMPGLLVTSLLGKNANQMGNLHMSMEKACRQSPDSTLAIDVVTAERAAMEHTTWTHITVRGRASEVDAALSAVFFMVGNAAAWKRQLASFFERKALIQSHVAAFTQRRAELRPLLTSGEFLSLRTSDTSPAASPTTIAGAVTAQPCMGNMQPDGCRQPQCPYSHAPYVDVFVTHCSQQLARPVHFPSFTSHFQPVLATVPHSSPLRYVVSFPLPRILEVVERTIPSSSAAAALKALTNVDVVLGELHGEWRAHQPGDVPEDWLALRAQGTKELIDPLMEWVFWHMERGVHVDNDQDREESFREHLLTVRHQKAQCMMGADDFFSLSSRGAPAFPAAPPLTTPPSAGHPRVETPPPVPVPESQSPDSPSSSPTSTWPSRGPSSFGSAAAPVAALAQSLSPYPSVWYDAGRVLTINKALHVPDVTLLPVAYLRCLPTTTFACFFSIAAVEAVREHFQFALEGMNGAMGVSAIEDTFSVSVYVPRILGIPSSGDAQQQWLSVTVWKNHGGGADGEDAARCLLQVVDALRALVARHDAMVKTLKLATLPIPTEPATTARAPGTAKRAGGPSSEEPEGKRARTKEL